MKNFPRLTMILFGILLTSCDGLFQYNPNQILLKDDERDLNAKNIEKIKSLPVKDTLRFILMGDTQRWYDETVKFVESANKQRDIDFVLHAGDISDFGITKELKWINEIMQNLRYPYLTVIGNHDIVANGSDAYVRMFGPLDYSFVYGHYKFIFINTNSLEYGLDGSTPNVPWLKAQLTDNPDKKETIVIGHVPPFDADFDRNLEKDYTGALASDTNLKFTLYGHQHAFKEGEFYDDGVQYYLTTSMGARGYLVITSWKGGYKVERIEF
ncbi:metallophosphoesterase [Dyadobacter sp. CY356]|uniref:metallophosphoesterase family protein n=1 Tax=Dyadobacter sp. CY356 TaxID=2906442 RepID=UPI001F316EE6|nr:metallophosphoesterase [Dyadobacter sp. CY356]MCF0059277.1 metallophosphoesterase [Dyadobacter sp. CY356]